MKKNFRKDISQTTASGLFGPSSLFFSTTESNTEKKANEVDPHKELNNNTSDSKPITKLIRSKHNLESKNTNDKDDKSMKVNKKNILEKRDKKQSQIKNKTSETSEKKQKPELKENVFNEALDKTEKTELKNNVSKEALDKTEKPELKDNVSKEVPDKTEKTELKDNVSKEVPDKTEKTELKDNISKEVIDKTKKPTTPNTTSIQNKTTAANNTKKWVPKSRIVDKEKKSKEISAYFRPTTFSKFKILAESKNTSINSLLEEAIHVFFEDRKKGIDVYNTPIYIEVINGIEMVEQKRARYLIKFYPSTYNAVKEVSTSDKINMNELINSIVRYFLEFNKQ